MNFFKLFLFTILAFVFIFEGSQLAMNIGATILVGVVIAAVILLHKKPIVSIESDCLCCKKGLMIEIRSQFIKKCNSCGHEKPWELKPGQRPLIENNRRVKKS